MSDRRGRWRGLLAAVAGTALVFSATVAAAGSAVAAGENRTASASKTTELDPNGETITVTGSGFDPAKGIYVALCVDNGAGQVATPCIGGADMSGGGGSSVWISSNPPTYGEGLAQPYGSNGSFQVSLRVAASDQFADCRSASNGCVIYVRADHTRSSDRTQDVRIPVTFAGSGTTSDSGSGSGGSGSGGSGGESTGSGDVVQAGSLPSTGSSPFVLVGSALLLLGVGGALLSAARRGRRARGVVAGLAIAGLAGALVTAPAPSALAAPGDVFDGTLSWGVRASFANYITGPIAHGSISTDGGATRSDGRLHFPGGGGSVAEDGSAAALTFAGSVHFEGHDYGNGALLDIELSNLRFVASGNTGSIIADIDSRPFEGADPNAPVLPIEHHADVEVVTVDLAGQDLAPDAGGTVTLTGAPTNLTEAGSEAFAGFYQPGDAFDPVSFTVTVETTPPGVAPSVTTHPADVEVEEGEDATFTAAAAGDPEPTVQWESSDGSGWTNLDGATGATLTLPSVDLDLDGTQYRAVFTNDLGEATSDAAALTVTEADTGGEPVWEPVLELVDETGDPLDVVPTAGAMVTVRGSGFDPQANLSSRPPVTVGQPSGVYVVFGDFDENWRPSEGAGGGSRRSLSQKWAMPEPSLTQVATDFPGQAPQLVELTAVGTFEAELEIVPVDDPAGVLGVYTYAGGGAAANADQELFVPVTFGNARQPALSVEPSYDLSNGDDIDVSGTGYAPDRWLYVAVTPQGESGDGHPSPFSNSKRVQTAADGTFSVTIEDLQAQFTNEDADVDCTVLDCYVASFSSPLEGDNDPVDLSGDRSQDVFVPISFAADPGPVPAPGGPVVVDDGVLDWGVKESFRNYLVGSIAHGEIEPSGGATRNADGTFRFSGAAGMVDAAAGQAELDFSGTVRFTGHDDGAGPLLEFTLTDPTIVVDGDAGVLIADVTSTSLPDGRLVDYPSVEFAELDFTGVSLAVDADGELTVSGVPAVLTAAGVPAFADFYEAGDALDPISFTLGTSDVPEPVDQTCETGFDADGVPFAPGACAGYPVVDAELSADSVEPRDELDVAAAGAGGGERVQTWVFSTPQHLGTTTAAAAGSVSDTVTIPADITTGQHTIVLAGEDGFRAEATITVTSTNAGGGSGGPIEITDGYLDWGVKESFRSYITGTIAHGEWEVDDSATEDGTPFRFPVADGTYVPGNTSIEAGFDGSVRFHGHDYGDGPLLDLTIANPSVEIDGTVGTLLVDVRSKGLDNPDEWFEEQQVEFATLDLSGYDLTPADGVVTLENIPATLTADRADGFAGFYEAGDDLDPVTLVLALDESELPPPGSGGSGDSDGGSKGGSGSGGLPKTGAEWALVALVGLVLLGAGIAVTLAVQRRRRDLLT